MKPACCAPRLSAQFILESHRLPAIIEVGGRAVQCESDQLTPLSDGRQVGGSFRLVGRLLSVNTAGEEQEQDTDESRKELFFTHDLTLFACKYTPFVSITENLRLILFARNLATRRAYGRFVR